MLALLTAPPSAYEVAMSPCLLDPCHSALERNGFTVVRATDAQHAGELFLSQLLPPSARRVSWGDSQTLHQTGILAQLEAQPQIDLIKTFERDVAWKELIERRRQALLTDLFVTGSNAITLSGQLVNLDMIGNRTAALCFGPKQVVVFVGRNKLEPTLDAAMERVRQQAAPANARRHQFSTPCVTDGRCHDCRSPQRICNNWSIVEKAIRAAVSAWY